MNKKNALAGLLTYSPFGRPSRPDKIAAVAMDGRWLWSLQLRDSPGLFTWFPFNPPILSGEPKAMQM